MRERQRMTQAELARRAGMDNGTVGDFLRGERWPRPDSLAAIERVLDLRLGSLESIAAGEIDQPPADGSPEPEVAQVLAIEMRGQLNPELAEFTDDDLVIEIRRRLLYAAAQLHALGGESLVFRVDVDGGDAVTARPTREPLTDR